MSESQTWTNQAKINGRLCQVDWRLISALKEISAALRGLGVNVNKLDAFVTEADQISETVAIPDPPGCDPTNRTSPPTS